MQSEFFILRDGEVVPAELLEWAQWFEDPLAKLLKRSYVTPTRDDPKIEMVTPVPWVSTIFMGTPHGHDADGPVMWETMIFEGPLDRAQWRCSTREKAERTHNLALCWAKWAHLDKIGELNLRFAPELLATDQDFIYGLEFERVYEDGRRSVVLPLLYGRASLGIGTPDDPPSGYISGYRDQWEFPSLLAARRAQLLWQPDQTPEPTGWDRHARSGRRRPDGDPAHEHILND